MDPRRPVQLSGVCSLRRVILGVLWTLLVTVHLIVFYCMVHKSKLPSQRCWATGAVPVLNQRAHPCCSSGAIRYNSHFCSIYVVVGGARAWWWHRACGSGTILCMPYFPFHIWDSYPQHLETSLPWVSRKLYVLSIYVTFVLLYSTQVSRIQVDCFRNS